jgi:hypothetical protein
MVNAAGLVGDALQLAIEIEGVFLQLRDVGVRIQRGDAARRMPGGARGQLVLVEQHQVRPADLRQMIQHRDADDAPSDDDSAGDAFHEFGSFRRKGTKPLRLGLLIE